MIKSIQFFSEIKNEPEIDYDFSVYFGFIIEKFKKFGMPMFSSMFPKSGLTNLAPIFHYGLKSPAFTGSFEYFEWIFKIVGNFSICCEVRIENLDAFDIDVFNIDSKNLKMEIGLKFPALRVELDFICHLRWSDETAFQHEYHLNGHVGKVFLTLCNSTPHQILKPKMFFVV